MSTTSSSPSPLHTLVLSYLTPFTTLKGTDFLPLLSPTYKHTFAPRSLNPPGPFHGPEKFATHVSHLGNIMKSFAVTPIEIWTNETKGEATVWAESRVVWRDELGVGDGKGGFRKEEGEGREVDWEYRGEYVFMLEVNEQGKVERMVEFLDSLATERLRALTGLARKRRAELVKEGKWVLGEGESVGGGGF